MSPRTRSAGLAALVPVLVVLGGAGPVGALSPTTAGFSLHDGRAAPAPTASPTSAPHQHEHEAPSPTPSDGHGDHEVPSPVPSEEHGDHDTTPPDTVSDTTRTLVLGGFGVLNAGILAAAALVRRRQRRPRAAERSGPRR